MANPSSAVARRFMVPRRVRRSASARTAGIVVTAVTGPPYPDRVVSGCIGPASGDTPPMAASDLHRVQIHGHEVVYRDVGDGPVLLLLHGIAGSSRTWREVMPALAGDYRMIAPDLLGHGESAKPLGDYSLGAYASGLRDLLGVLGVERATVVGHSLGGGVAMQLAYQHPEVCERLVLVDSGGLGREVSPILRAVTLPVRRVRAAARLPVVRAGPGRRREPLPAATGASARAGPPRCGWPTAR